MTTHRDICDLNFTLNINKNGGRYVRAYKNRWDTSVKGTNGKKGQSRMAMQLYVGTLKPNGQVKLSKGFLEKMPAFANKVWYYENNVLYDEAAYREQHPEIDAALSAAASNPPRDSDDESEQSPSVQMFGATYGLSQMARNSGITSSLADTVGESDAQALIGLTLYSLLSKQSSAACYEEWAKTHYVHAAARLSGQRISELFQRITPERMDQFFSARYRARVEAEKRQGKTTPRLCALDSTSISVMSQTNRHAEYGHSKDDPSLRQINLTVVMECGSGEIIFACEYNGSINDVSGFTYVCDRMQRCGIDLQDLIFVVDRGYSSAGNQNYLMRSGSQYVMGEPIRKNTAVWKLLMNEQKNSARDLFHDQTLHDQHGIHVTTLKETWKTDAGLQTVFVHVYRDPTKALEAKLDLRRAVGAMVSKANQGREAELASDSDFRELRRFMSKIDSRNHGAHQVGDPVWVANQERLREHHRKAGCFVIRTNRFSDPIEALKVYRDRNIIEVGFRMLKNNVDDRLHTQGGGYYGKLLTFLLGESLCMMIRHNAAANPVVNGKSVKLLGDSLNRTLANLDSIFISRLSPDKAWTVDKITATQRGYFEGLLKVKTPPRHL